MGFLKQRLRSLIPETEAGVKLTEMLKKLRFGPYEVVGKVLSDTCATDYHKVVFQANAGRGYSCNPKYIAEALNRMYPDEFDLVMLVVKRDSTVPTYIRQVHRGSLQALRELASARFWISNSRVPWHIAKREDQVYIQTWHASVGPKRVERDAEDALPSYVPTAKRDGAITDLMIANNDHMASVIKNSFWYDGPVIRCGAPRNRPLILPDFARLNHVREQLGVLTGAKICLYAPTFRRDLSLDGYCFGFEACLRALRERFGGEWAFAYRLHPNLAKLGRPGFFEGYTDATGFSDAQELIAAVDVLISDYSSILEDFALTGRPGFVYAPDIEEYKADRGFYYPLEKRPFPIAQSSEELVAEIEHFDEEEYDEARREFFRMVGLEDDGLGDEAVARVVEALSRKGSTISNAV